VYIVDISRDILLNISNDSHFGEPTSSVKRWMLYAGIHRGETKKMCYCCHDDWGCYGPHYYPRHYGPIWRYYEEPTPQERRGYLEEEKRFLEQRLKEIDSRIAESSK
jgi:hypothetical protein